MKKLKIYEVELDTEDADVLGSDFVDIANSCLKDKEEVLVLVIKTDEHQGQQVRMYDISQAFKHLGVDNLIILPVKSTEDIAFFRSRRIHDESN